MVNAAWMQKNNKKQRHNRQTMVIPIQFLSKEMCSPPGYIDFHHIGHNFSARKSIGIKP